MEGELHGLLARLPHARRQLLEILSPDSCIETSRVVQMLLRERGLPARVMPVCLVVRNEAGVRWANGGAKTGREWQVVVGDPRYRRPGGWPGHLVVLCEGLLIDASADQANRPQRGIRIDGPLVLPTPSEFATGQAPARTALPDGADACYWGLPGHDSYRRTKAWMQAPILLPLARKALQT